MESAHEDDMTRLLGDLIEAVRQTNERLDTLVQLEQGKWEIRGHLAAAEGRMYSDRSPRPIRATVPARPAR